ncbi:hypothetical protein A2422_01945 [Candidatus Woesebacteria bacterium RIFOXYC1_FULL_31_51]|uniref:Glycosyl transferase family 2 n=1 Tax=Candidatus Woesebacteria bacterium GW2011_GWC2_31_9 TaxID=1618586 RepID=A0A0F9YKX1_9BACT|nr:MAG: family 2 glycosyl transferase [Candidatus Woesebacteria bacterium GW2011_GWF1_31_35]KKP23610.1 MAG: Glycosyl transferase family 2 [Candidatus Woesebacteria bacterium GW2011_GWC1_30_29]KKP27009.1 MAG: Glycosyl transferase family 2 [Candidatus Woesebacteria bacterium GW2011_GWD1_31_12]KKP27885.1 MAG: Glycosyl transferase family 2 [Candidatus Woesebacteria bacterium GW2011_GWB1_31_29]KKP31888.1 MAG: Glycosyl transferase family 2 [Candidatus Woesebacteria bacterium GW2011_GWC2_31_9]KKP3407
MIQKNNLEIITLDKKNISNFSLERNNLLEKSKSDWILFLDKDEIVTNELKNEIVNEINNLPNKYEGYYIKRRIKFLSKIIGHDRVLRLAKKNSGKWVRRVHEVWQVKGPIKQLKNYIIHTTAQNLHDYIEKINFQSDLHALENNKEGKKANLGKIIFYPILKLIYNLLLGRGFEFSLMQSLHSFLSWTKLYFLQA